MNNKEIYEFIQKNDELIIPNKLHKVIEFIPKENLLTINKDINVAKELCLLFLSFLNETSFERNIDGKRLNALSLIKFLSPKEYSTKTRDLTYKKIINVLLTGTDNGPIITVSNDYSINNFSKTYNLVDKYKTGFRKYTLKTEYVKNIKYKNQVEQLVNTTDNVIAKNSLEMYTIIELPTVEELLEVGKKLAKNKTLSKKGKIYTMRHRHTNDNWKDHKNRSFIEDDIKMFEYYTKFGFIIPTVGTDRCARVYDSINLLPRWIRQEIKMKGERTKESDYTCLHPNIIQKIYNGNLKFINHKDIATKLNKDVTIIKKDHLSYFNTKTEKMNFYSVSSYYNKYNTNVVENVMKDKNENGYKIVSIKLFKMETELMEKVISKCNELNMFPIYIFDALEINESDYDVVTAIMNVCALEMGIYTNTGINTDIEKCNEIIKEKTKEIEIANEWIMEYIKEINTIEMNDDVEIITSNETKEESNMINQEEKESSLEETKTKELITIKEYEDFLKEEDWYKLVSTNRIFKDNKRGIFDMLFEKQQHSPTKIKQLITEYIKTIK